MNKLAKALTCAALGGAMLFTVACNKGGQGNDTESRWLALSLGQPDGVFNPYFSTSLVDSKVISMTQASLITSDYDEATDRVKAVAGEDQPTVAKAFEIKYYDSMTPGEGSECAASGAADNGRTEYRFLIKKGMKFSDGKDLTIKDVLFNFYVYLDPVYTGSNTMYSVDIQGLNAYRNNDHSLADGDGGSDAYTQNARARIQHLIDFGNQDIRELSEQGRKDFEYVKKVYKEELTTDWNNMVSSWVQTYEINYTFEYAWQAYLFQEGQVEAQRRQYTDGTIREIRVDPVTHEEIDPRLPENKEAYNSGKILTTLDNWADGAYNGGSTAQRGAQHLIDQFIDEVSGEPKFTDEETIKNTAIGIVYNANLPDSGIGLQNILTYWATASTVFSDFVAEERGKALEGSVNPQYFISGIRTEKVTMFDLDGNGQEENLDGTYDVLKIIINRVDPAAIWQFGITIAPMHYYSGTYQGTDYVAKFNGDTAVTDYSGSGDANICFGVKRGDFNFFQEVLRAERKSGVPVGAGPYKASTENGGTANTKGEFYDNNLVNYERNEYFNTMGQGIENAKIKRLRYKVVDESRIISSVESGDIDYGEPNATQTNLAYVDGHSDKLGRSYYDTNGFGYVGVNPTYVPVLEVRQIIMRAMDVGLSVGYYGDLGNVLYRPMSRTSWAYPDRAGDYFEEQGMGGLGSPDDVEQELINIGCKKGTDGIFEDEFGNKLKYTFTIAGANSDHPAYNMFNMAAEKLNQCGFEITVSTDPNALLKLTSGKLAVWAAAWSSGVDPDMYQVYHKDSQASSTLNWGYSTIYNDQTPKYQDERDIIDAMSLNIMAARRTTDEDERAEIYETCLNQLMSLAVELPVYQRKDLCVYNKAVLDPASLNQHPNATIGLIDRIWEVTYI